VRVEWSARHGEHTLVHEIHPQTRGTHASARALLVNDKAATLGSRGPVMTMGWRL
jgi:hypothetical protein